MTIINIILTIAATTTALIAGLLYAYSCSVNIELGRLADAEYISAMQSINKAIQNPLFFISFMGTLLLLPLCTYLHYGQPLSNRFWFLLISTMIYAIGVVGVTALGNVPLNEALDKFNLSSASVGTIFWQTNNRSGDTFGYGAIGIRICCRYGYPSFARCTWAR